VRQDTQQGALTFEMEGLLYLPWLCGLKYLTNWNNWSVIT
jgi:hypothetical protein